VAVEGIARDRTEQLLARAALQQSLHEKELLLKEIHHRVKNNLTLVTSLLELQAARSADARLREMLSISQKRILSVARIHEALSQSEDVGRIDLSQYLTRLGNELAEAYGAGARSFPQWNQLRWRCVTQPGRKILNELIPRAAAFAGIPRPTADRSTDVQPQRGSRRQ
jgi:hypothetical protein